MSRIKPIRVRPRITLSEVIALIRRGYVVVIMDYARNIKDTPFATFDRALAEEIALAYAWEEMWLCWYKRVHFHPASLYGAISSVYQNKLTDFKVEVKEIPWYG